MARACCKEGRNPNAETKESASSRGDGNRNIAETNKHGIHCTLAVKKDRDKAKWRIMEQIAVNRLKQNIQKMGLYPCPPLA
jgi:hypothetical protein